MEQRLSDFLLDQVELYDIDGVNLPSKRDRTARIYLERIAEEIIAAREGFTDEKFAILEKALQNEPEINEGEIDRVLSCRALSDIPAMIKRLIRLSRLDAARIPSNQTIVYIREAARTYFHGLFQSSAAMSRAALEQSIKDVLGRQGDSDFIRFQDLLKVAEKKKILDQVIAKAVRDTAEKANRVLHEAPTDEVGALDILISTRALVVQIYSAQGGF